MSDKHYLLTPFSQHISAFGKGNLIHILNNGGMTSEIIRNFYMQHYKINNDTWQIIFNQHSSMLDTSSYNSPFKPIRSLITNLNTIENDTTNLLTTDIVMQIMLKIENALKISTKSYNTFCAINNEEKKTNSVIFQNAIQAQMDYIVALNTLSTVTSSKLIVETEFRTIRMNMNNEKSLYGYYKSNTLNSYKLARTNLINAEINFKDAQTKHDIAKQNADEGKTRATNAFNNINNLHAKMKNIYDEYYNDDSDLSLYEIQPLNSQNSFSDNSILFTSCIGHDMYNMSHKLHSLLLDNSTLRNGRPLSFYGNEFAIEMMQNSVLQSFQNVDKNLNTYISSHNLSCGFSIIRDPKPSSDTYTNKGVLNIRFYCSYVFQFNKKKYAISSGINLFDILDISKFRDGVSSSNFITLLSNLCMMMNANQGIGFTENDTTWEFGSISNFEKLKCISSNRVKYWNNLLMKDCFLRGSTIDIPKRMYNIILYLNTNYISLENNQIILISYTNGVEKITSIIQIFIDVFDSSIITFKTKDVRIDNIFPIQNTNADTIISGELQISNYKGDTLLHVDPVTDTATIMGKLGVNQELHEIRGMVDIDNLSNRNMKDFIDKFSPLILDTIKSISDEGYNTSYPSITSVSEPGIALQIYNSEHIPSSLTREERFGLIQARVELPLRSYVVTDLMNMLDQLDTTINGLNGDISRLTIQYNKAYDEEASERFWNDVAMVAILVTSVMIQAVAASVASTIGPLANAVIEVFKNIVATSANLIIDYAVFTDEISKLVDASSDEINQYITQAKSMLDNTIAQRRKHLELIELAREETNTQEELLGLSLIYESLAVAKQNSTYATKLSTIFEEYITRKNLPESTMEDVFSQYTTHLTSINNTPEEQFQIYIDNTIIQFNSRIDNTQTATEFLHELKTENFDQIAQIKQLITNGVIEVMEATTASDSNYTTQYNELQLQIDNLQYKFDVATFRLTGFQYFETIFSTQNSLTDFLMRASIPWQYGLISVYNDNSFDAYLKQYISHFKQHTDYPTIFEVSEQGSIQNTQINYGDLFEEIINGHSVIQGKIKEYAINTRFSFSRFTSIIWHELTNKRFDNDGYFKHRGYWNPMGGYLQNIIHETKNIQTKYKSELNELIKNRDNLHDDLQKFTTNHNWNPETHNTLKMIITNIYKTVRFYELNDNYADHMIVMPVTDNDDNTTSLFYLKMSVKGNITTPTLQMSGYSLNIDEFTRDKSYRDTLMKLIHSLTSASQFVNYGTILSTTYSETLLKTSEQTIITEQIKTDGLFNERFGNNSLQLIIDDMTNNKIIQHEQYPHWNGKSVEQLFIPNTNIKMNDIYANLNNAFIAKYDFQPISENGNLHKNAHNVFIVPLKYKDVWYLSVMRFYEITHNNNEKICYRISCNISVNDHIEQSIIAKGDSLFYGDITVKSTNNNEIFQIDTLNKTTSNMYPLGIGTQNPKTMLDIQDTSINNIKDFINHLAEKMSKMNEKVLSITNDESDWQNNLVTDTTHIYYIYEFNMDTKLAQDVQIISYNAYEKWMSHSFREILNHHLDQDNRGIIEKYMLPTIQKSIDEILFYDGGFYTELNDSEYGLKYSINRIFIKNNKFYSIGYSMNIQQYNINLIYNENISNLFNQIDEKLRFMNYIKFNERKTQLNMNNDYMNLYITDLLSRNTNINKNLFSYTFVSNPSILLDHKVSDVSITDSNKFEVGNSSVINSIEHQTTEQKLLKELHTSFMVQYHKYYASKSDIIKGDIGMLSCQNNDFYYYVSFYKYDDDKLIAFFVNITSQFMTPSVSLNGDMSISGELSLYKQTSNNTEVQNKYITIDPVNNFLGINTNERFINYTLDYSTTSSSYNSKHHCIAFSKNYPNFAFERVAEIPEIEGSEDYSKFGSYSSSTMVRVSELWNYSDIIERVGYLNNTNGAYSSEINISPISVPPMGDTNSITWMDKTVKYDENHFNWRMHKTYGPDISFEIKDKTGITTELGEVKMVIDHIDESGNIHSGFGVQVIDNNLSQTFDSSLKNIMYVNNQKELFVDGVWLGGKLLRADGDYLMWGDKKIHLE